jgi:hypothetical protein
MVLHDWTWGCHAGRKEGSSWNFMHAIVHLQQWFRNDGLGDLQMANFDEMSNSRVPPIASTTAWERTMSQRAPAAWEDVYIRRGNRARSEQRHRSMYVGYGELTPGLPTKLGARSGRRFSTMVRQQRIATAAAMSSSSRWDPGRTRRRQIAWASIDSIRVFKNLQDAMDKSWYL